MTRPGIALMLTAALLAGCNYPETHKPPAAVAVPERIPSSEISMTAHLVSDVHAGTVLQITLRNVGQRVLFLDTGILGFPMANFAFSLQTPDQQWLQLYCHLCMPGSSSQPSPYTIRLRPTQFLTFTVPLSTFVAADPHTGNAIALRKLHGRMLIELQVPTPPGAGTQWPGYVNASVPLP